MDNVHFYNIDPNPIINGVKSKMRMNKKKLGIVGIFLILIILAASIIGWKYNQSKKCIYLRAAILVISDDDVLIQEVNSKNEKVPGEEIKLGVDDFSGKISEFKVGDKIVVAYTGEISEVYPRELDVIYSITKDGQ